MANTNCLEGMRCPNSECRSDGPFTIRGEATFDVTDDGTGDYESVEWFDDSPCTCKKCMLCAKVEDFCESESS
jgi:hypothetical protein